jgi:hypothetical protein
MINHQIIFLTHKLVGFVFNTKHEILVRYFNNSYFIIKLHLIFDASDIQLFDLKYNKSK